MINYIIPILSHYLSSGFFTVFILPIFCLAFISAVPVIIRYFFRR